MMQVLQRFRVSSETVRSRRMSSKDVFIQINNHITSNAVYMSAVPVVSLSIAMSHCSSCISNRFVYTLCVGGLESLCGLKSIEFQALTTRRLLA